MSELQVSRSINFPPAPEGEPWLNRLSIERWSGGLWFEGTATEPPSEVWFTLVMDGALTVRLGTSDSERFGAGTLHVTRQSQHRNDGLGVAPGDFCDLAMCVFEGKAAMAGLRGAMPERTSVFRVARATVLADK